MTLKFEFINHSCFILTNNNITLAVDPWLEGSVFNKSWELLVDTPKSSLGNVKNCDYIYKIEDGEIIESGIPEKILQVDN